jgi:Ca2+ regulator and membrane fusion protein Fig1
MLRGAWPSWYEDIDSHGDEIEVKPFPIRTSLKAVAALHMLSAMLLLISTLWQHVAAAVAADSISNATGRAVSSHVGGTSMALAWAAVGVTVVVSIESSVRLKFIENLEMAGMTFR